MDYNLNTSSGNIVVYNATTLIYKGLIIIGQDIPYWNGPLQQNFVTLVDKFDTKLDSVINQDLIADLTNAYSLGSADKVFKDLFLGGSIYLNGNKTLSLNNGSLELKSNTDQTLKVLANGVGDVVVGSTGTGKVKVASALELGTGVRVSTHDGSSIKFDQGIEVAGDIKATTINGLNTTELAKTSEIPTKVSQLQNDSNYVLRANIVDDLASLDSTVPLSANQGRVLKVLINNINTLLQSDDINLDTIQELVNFIKANKSTLDSLTIGSISGLQLALDSRVLLTEFNAAINSINYTISTLATISNLNSYAQTINNIINSLAVANINGLQLALDEKASTALASGSVDGLMAKGDKAKLDGISANANNYVHPSTDGSHHVPATGTTNNGKVLKSGSTAGSEAWGVVDYSELSGKPSLGTASALNVPASGNAAAGEVVKGSDSRLSDARTPNSAGAIVSVKIGGTGMIFG